MKTGLTREQKTTSIFFDEKNEWMEVLTHNTDLKRRLRKFAKDYPEECVLLEEVGPVCCSFRIRKGRLSLRLTAPYTEERREKMSSWAKENGIAAM